MLYRVQITQRSCHVWMIFPKHFYRLQPRSHNAVGTRFVIVISLQRFVPRFGLSNHVRNFHPGIFGIFDLPCFHFCKQMLLIRFFEHFLISYLLLGSEDSILHDAGLICFIFQLFDRVVVPRTKQLIKKILKNRNCMEQDIEKESTMDQPLSNHLAI